jgi:hypothetical protein
MSKSQDLSEIADLARCLYRGYSETADRLKKEQAFLQSIRQTPSQKEHEAEAIRNCLLSSKVCDQWAADLARLVRLIERHLPAVWEDLRLVGRFPQWHTRGFDWNAAEKELRRIEAAAEQAKTGGATPNQYLASWREILVALGLKNNREDQQKVKKLNKDYSGPIIIPKRGAQPKSDRKTLIERWNGLEEKFHDSQQRRKDAQATAAAQHPFGQKGIVVPGISGGVRKRRRDRKG